MGRKKIMGKEPYLSETHEKEHRRKLQLAVRFEATLADRLKAAAYWVPGETVNAIVERGSLKELERVEASYEEEHGKPIPPKPE
jgi:hypothetical protein